MNASAAQDSDAPVATPLGERLRRLHLVWLATQGGRGGSFVDGPRDKPPGGGTTATGWRDYAPGDDYRYVDWPLCARRDDLLTRTFEGDEDRHIYLWVDCSRSMGLGRPEKFWLARRIAETLGYCALAGLDRLSVTAFSNRLVADSGFLRHRTRATPMLQFLDSLAPEGDYTDLTKAANDWLRLGRRPAPLVLISDLYDEGSLERAFDLLRKRGYELRVVQIYDPREVQPNVLGDVELVDVEGGASRRVTVTRRDLVRYRQALGRFLYFPRRYGNRYGLRGVQLPCDMPEREALAWVLRGGTYEAGSVVEGAGAYALRQIVEEGISAPGR